MAQGVRSVEGARRLLEREAVGHHLRDLPLVGLAVPDGAFLTSAGVISCTSGQALAAAAKARPAPLADAQGGSGVAPAETALDRYGRGSKPMEEVVQLLAQPGEARGHAHAPEVA